MKSLKNFNEATVRDNAGGYESMLDLFTLLSLILIIGAFVLQLQQSQSRTTKSQSEFIKAGGDALNSKIPEGVLVLLLTESGGRSLLTIAPGGQTAKNVPVSLQNYAVPLNEAKTELLTAKEVHYAVNITMDGGQLFFAIFSWLQSNAIPVKIGMSQGKLSL